MYEVRNGWRVSSDVLRVSVASPAVRWLVSEYMIDVDWRFLTSMINSSLTLRERQEEDLYLNIAEIYEPTLSAVVLPGKQMSFRCRFGMDFSLDLRR